MTTQEKYEGMALLKAELLKKWHRRRSMSVAEFRLYVTEAMELATAQLLLEAKVPPSPTTQMRLFSKVDGRELTPTTKRFSKVNGKEITEAKDGNP